METFSICSQILINFVTPIICHIQLYSKGHYIWACVTYNSYKFFVLCTVIYIRYTLRHTHRCIYLLYITQLSQMNLRYFSVIIHGFLFWCLCMFAINTTFLWSKQLTQMLQKFYTVSTVLLVIVTVIAAMNFDYVLVRFLAFFEFLHSLILIEYLINGT